MVRPISLQAFVASLEPSCLATDEEAMRERWTAAACPVLARAAARTGTSALDVRLCTFEMLRQSARRLAGAHAALTTANLSFHPGILSFLVAGSPARGESTVHSDIDLNVYVRDQYLDLLRRGRDAHADSPLRVVANHEFELRRQVQKRVIERLQAEGLALGARKITMKPFGPASVRPADGDGTAVIHLLNILFSDTPVYRRQDFDLFLNTLLDDPACVEGAVLGRLALLRAQAGRVSGEDALKAAHHVATCVSAIVTAGLQVADLQIPSWWTFDQRIAVEVLPSAVSEPPLGYITLVTLARGGYFTPDDEVLRFAMENGLAGLAVALDVILDDLEARGADEETMEVWARIADCVADPVYGLDLARRLGMG